MHRTRPGQLLALSYDTAASPAIGLRALDGPPDRRRPYGWGVAWYPAEDVAAMVIKDPTSIADNALTRILREWERYQSHLFLFHLRGAAERLAHEDTQPLCRSHGGRDWVFLHDGQLTPDLATALPLGPAPAYEPLGHTAAEHAFCWLLTVCREAGARRLADLGWDRLHDVFRRLNDFGPASFVVTDGEDLAVYQDRDRTNCLHTLRRTPPHQVPLEDDELLLRLDHDGGGARSVVLFSTHPLSAEPWRPLESSQLVVARRGVAIHDSHAGQAPGAGSAPLVVRRPLLLRPRLLAVTHETVYRYRAPVERSDQLLRLTPVHDAAQTVVEHSLVVSAGGVRHEFDDVFGNRATAVTIESPYTELRIESRALVRVDPRGVAPEVPWRMTLPLVWMPWQRQMMMPYLLPPELPETELRELSAFAMSFVHRQDADLLETLADMNATLHRDFTYVPGSTTLETTPFDVYQRRRGVCQDFANLFICLARLLSIPARYRVGYLHTGRDYANAAMSEASHAWAEVYIPQVGWRGFDPTNGRPVGVDHVRVACGRNYRDAAPTSGTIYAGGGGETLSVQVQVEVVGEGAASVRRPVGLQQAAQQQ